MSEPGRSDHWDLLASELGAESTSEEVEKGPASAAERPDATLPPPPPEATVGERLSEERPARARRPAPNWDAVASALGLTPEPETEEAASGGGPAERVLGEAARKGPGEEAEAGEAAEGPLGVGGWPRSMFDRPGAKGREAPARPAEEPAEMAEESSWIAEEPAGVGEGRAEVTEERKPARRRRKRRRKPREPGRIAGEQRDAEKADQVSEAAVEEPEEREAAGDEGQPEKGRSRRGRKRAAPRKKRKRISIADEAAADQPEEAPTKPDITAAKVGKPTEIEVEEGEAEEDETEEDETEEGEAEEGARSSKAGHRAIPTWEEAVGMIISTNLEARARNPSTGFSRSRGKGRGPSKRPASRERPPEQKKS